jgi:hypothetical protein
VLSCGGVSSNHLTVEKLSLGHYGRDCLAQPNFFVNSFFWNRRRFISRKGLIFCVGKY